ncbi:hypothetical protein, partial [Streptomyces sp. WAC 01325]|uniref:hypothetical protein n=1 Tax=Streptomyces sp. WAC 01325 TaxID=2203202 RepID=UPI001C8DBCC6
LGAVVGRWLWVLCLGWGFWPVGLSVSGLGDQVVSSVVCGVQMQCVLVSPVFDEPPGCGVGALFFVALSTAT